MSDWYYDGILPKKKVVEITQIKTTKDLPCLFLSILNDESIKIVSTLDEEFYKLYMKSKRLIKSGKYGCDSKTQEFLDMGIEMIYQKFEYPEDVYILGRNNYIYNNLCKQAKYAKEFEKIALYDWKRDWVKNLQTLGCEFYTSHNDDIYVKIEQKDKKIDITTAECLSFPLTKYYIVNAYFSVLLRRYVPESKKIVFSHINNQKEDIVSNNFPYVFDINSETVGILVSSFDSDIEIFTRQLLMPYDDFYYRMSEYTDDDFKKLDYLCDDYNYPRGEIKKRMAECFLINKKQEEITALEDKNKQKKKGFLKKILDF